MPKPRLALRRECLTELSRDEIVRVVGAASMQACLSLVGDCPNSLPDCNSLFCTNGPCASDFKDCGTN